MYVLENSRISLVLTSVFTVPLNISFMVLTPKYIWSTWLAGRIYLGISTYACAFNSTNACYILLIAHTVYKNSIGNDIYNFFDIATRSSYKWGNSPEDEAGKFKIYVIDFFLLNSGLQEKIAGILKNSVVLYLILHEHMMMT